MEGFKKIRYNEFVELTAVKTKEVINTVGAGDALFSAFIHFYAKGMEEKEEEIERWYEELYHV